MESFRPETAEQTVEAVAWAFAEEAQLEVIGSGSKAGLGRPVQASQGLDLSGLSGITLYEPEELVLSARVGTPLSEIEATLAEQGQLLAFEPPDFAPIYGGAAGGGTIGGVLACNLAGSRRIKAGAARDHFLGFEAVSGRGELFKSGGRVVKNVTGYDLCKLLAGSFGTLAVMTEVTVKVLPGPEKTRTVLIFGLDDDQACAAMTRALTSSHEVSGAAHLPVELARASAIDLVAEAGAAVTALRVEGPGPSVEHRTAALRRELADLGSSEELHSLRSAKLWPGLGGGAPFQGDRDWAIWRVSVAPQSGPALVAQVRDDRVRDDQVRDEKPFLHYYDWGGGLVWLAVPAEEEASQERVRAAVKAVGSGHATLVRAPLPLRATVSVFQPQDPAMAALSERIKDSFDPCRILNPGRMYPGI